MWYLGSYAESSLTTTAIANAFAYFVLLSYIIPISLIVTLEMSRFIQGKLMEMDEKMQVIDEDGETTMHVKNTNLNDELALVKHICSDKTGTLTQNVMIFAHASIAGQKFSFSQLMEHSWQNSPDTPAEKLEMMTLFIRALAICHNAMSETENNGFFFFQKRNSNSFMFVFLEIHYSSTSPDEVALCHAAAKCKFEFTSRTLTSLTVNELGKKKKQNHFFCRQTNIFKRTKTNL